MTTKRPLWMSAAFSTADPTPSISVQVWDNDGGSGFDNAASGSDITVVVYSDADSPLRRRALLRSGVDR